MALLTHSIAACPLPVRSRVPAGIRPWLRAVALALGALLLGASAGFAATPTGAVTLNENEVKAAAFYNVIAFTNWPREAFESAEAPLVIGILGYGAVASIIERLVQGETWHGRKIVVQHYGSAREMKTCHALFVARSERQNWSNLRAQFTNRPVLAISDSDNFAEEGGNVQLAIERNKLRILVNLAATRANGIQLSSNLLHLSTIVGPMPDSPAPHSGLKISPGISLQSTIASIY